MALDKAGLLADLATRFPDAWIGLPELLDATKGGGDVGTGTPQVPETPGVLMYYKVEIIQVVSDSIGDYFQEFYVLFEGDVGGTEQAGYMTRPPGQKVREGVMEQWWTGKRETEGLKGASLFWVSDTEKDCVFSMLVWVDEETGPPLIPAHWEPRYFEAEKGAWNPKPILGTNEQIDTYLESLAASIVTT